MKSLPQIAAKASALVHHAIANGTEPVHRAFDDVATRTTALDADGSMPPVKDDVAG
jgi:hypothetical protein